MVKRPVIVAVTVAAVVPMVAIVAILALSLSLAACGPEAATTTTKATAAKTTTTSTKPTAAAASSTTSTTQPIVVWQTVRYEQNTPGLAYSGSWTYSSAPAASKGGFVYADSGGASLTFEFVGSYCAWLAKTANLYGKAKITVDDGNPTTVDLYSKNTTWSHVVWETKSLPFGNHTVKIEWTGKKKAGSKGTRIDLDAVEITGALIGRYQQNDPHLKYAGRWSTTKDRGASGGSFALTRSSHSSVTLHFTGVQIDWLAKVGPAYGKAQVVVDGGDPALIELYNTDVLWRQNVWTSGRLAMGPHEVEIRWTGTKNPNATGTYINVDAFDIAGAMD